MDLHSHGQTRRSTVSGFRRTNLADRLSGPIPFQPGYDDGHNSPHNDLQIGEEGLLANIPQLLVNLFATYPLQIEFHRIGRAGEQATFIMETQ